MNDPISTIIRAIIGKKAVDTASQALNSDTAKGLVEGAKQGMEMVGQRAYDTAAGAVNLVGDTATKAKDKATEIINSATEKGKSAFGKALDSYFKMFGLGYKDGQVYSPSVEKAISKAMKKDENSLTSLGEVLEALERDANAREGQKNDAETVAEAVVEEAADNAGDEDSEDIITYTYKPGDTFGQVLLNLGLSDGRNLWGRGGDVEYYTQQLIAQDMLDRNGNVKLGTPFKLRRRK